MREKSVILWERLDLPGHEICELSRFDDGWRLKGVALLADDGRPCKLEYEIACDASWQTRHAHVWGHVGDTIADLTIERAHQTVWRVNGAILPALEACVDIDLGFSPSTNLLPIRRLSLAVGQHADVRAVWVRFPDLEVEVLEQRYARTGERSYRYKSAGGAFVRDLTINDVGFVVDYPGLWREAGNAEGR